MSLVAAPVGSSRVIAYVHSLIEIVGRLVIGIVSTYIAHWLYTLWEKRHKVSKNTT
jgi:membrane-associated phospholipid phosphatase